MGDALPHLLSIRIGFRVDTLGQNRADRRRIRVRMKVLQDEIDIADEAMPEVEREFARFWRETPKHVVSRGRPALRANADLLEGDVVEAVRRMKAADGPDIMLGAGAELLATLSAAGLIDTYRLLLTPMALGNGKALFASLEAPLALRLVGTRTFSSGSVLLEYEPA